MGKNRRASAQMRERESQKRYLQRTVWTLDPDSCAREFQMNSLKFRLDLGLILDFESDDVCGDPDPLGCESLLICTSSWINS